MLPQHHCAGVWQRRVDDLSKGAHGRKWEGCRVYRNYRAMLADKPLPDAVIIGVPPSVRGMLGRIGM